jgi:hypothetical protein
MKNQRFKLRNSNQYVHILKGAGKYSEVLLPFGRESRKGYRGVVMTVKNENLIEEKSGGYNYG